MTGVVRQAEGKGLMDGIKVGQKKIPMSMFQFVDDIVFVCKAKTQNIMVIKSMFRCFEIVSSLKVNFKKSKTESLGV